MTMTVLVFWFWFFWFLEHTTVDLAPVPTSKLRSTFGNEVFCDADQMQTPTQTPKGNVKNAM